MSKKAAVKPHGNAKYPWAKWFNGKTHRVDAVGYGREVESFRRQISGKAATMGKRAITRVVGEVIEVTAVER